MRLLFFFSQSQNLETSLKPLRFKFGTASNGDKIVVRDSSTHPTRVRLPGFAIAQTVVCDSRDLETSKCDAGRETQPQWSDSVAFKFCPYKMLKNTLSIPSFEAAEPVQKGTKSQNTQSGLEDSRKWVKGSSRASQAVLRNGTTSQGTSLVASACSVRLSTLGSGS